MSAGDVVAGLLFLAGVFASLALLCASLGRMPTRRLITVGLIAAFLLPLVIATAHAGTEQRALERSEQWKPAVTRAVRFEHGLGGPVALHGALIHQESRWREDAESWAGAQGLAQIMPATAEHIEELSGIRGFDSMNPRHAIQGAAAYTRWLYGMIDAEDQWPMILSAYNGGIGWLRRDQRKADDPARWWGSVEEVQTRGDAAQRENRAYVRAIMVQWQQIYLERGWPGPVIPVPQEEAQ